MIKKPDTRAKVPIDKSQLAYGEPERIRDKKFLAWLRTLPCCVTGQVFGSDPAHVSKFNAKGTSTKVSDIYAVPLSAAQHRHQHQVGEITFWGNALEEARTLGPELYELFKGGADRIQAQERIAQFRRFFHEVNRGRK